MTLWEKHFSSPMDEALWDLSESYSFDQALYAYDLEGSRAHVRGLARAGLLDEPEAANLLGALDKVEAEFAGDTFLRGPRDEDIHTAIERRVTELVGDVGAKLHTARSRNDQVATALRLFTRDALTNIARASLDLVNALIEAGDGHEGAYLPGYTHLQRAQPVLLSHHLQAHAFALLRDIDRLLDSRHRLNVSPLGAGALAGTSVAIDPAYTAALLGFETAFANSMDAVSDRDFVAEALFDVALLGVHMSRMGEELVLWTSKEFNFATLSAQFTTGSSMLPQKRNSDVAELARGKSGRFIGNLTGLLATLKGLPLAYNRDLQEDKEPLFDSVSQVLLVLRALAGAYRTLDFHEEVARASAEDPFVVATDLAEQLVGEGVPFRQAYERVGALAAEALAENVSLRDVVARTEGLQAHLAMFDPGATLARRRSPGASGPAASRDQAARLRRAIDEAARRL